MNYHVLIIIALFMSACGGGDNADGTQENNVNSSNSVVSNTAVPVATVTSLNEFYIAGETIGFSAENSSVADGSTVTYRWDLRIPRYSKAQLTSEDSETVYFRLDAVGQYVLMLTVIDDQNRSSSSAISITPSLPLPQTLPSYPSTPPPLPSVTDALDAVRLLKQSTFGPTVSSVEDLLAKGAEKWFEEQLTLPYSSWMDLRETDWIEEVDPLYEQNGRMWLEELFSESAQNSPDQLRHRVAYALSQLFVVSQQTDLGHREIAFMDYWDTLGRHAFGNFRELLEDVTLHVAMGHYLNMLGNQKADPSKNIRPDENFAREVMQLFTIGLRQLNLDGSVKKDETGEAIETYTQETITQYAAALTGWYFDTTGIELNKENEFGCSIHCFPIGIEAKPMAPYEHHHQKTEKQLLRGYFVPPGQTAREDLKMVLDSLFYHPNVAPFFSMHLIKHMVTSNPSPDYVARVSAVFNNNGEGVRGDIGATVQAVLFDPEARSLEVAASNVFGKVKEPLLAITHLNRLFDITLISPPTVSKDQMWGDNVWRRVAGTPSQRALNSETVFNFFRPDFAPNGLIADSGLVSPEFQITTESSVVNDVELFRWITTRELWEGEVQYGRDPNQFALAYDFTHLDKVWQEKGFAGVIDFLNLYMTANRMDENYIQNLLSFVDDPEYSHVFDGDDPVWSEHFTDQMERHQFLSKLIYVIATTPEFRVQR